MDSKPKALSDFPQKAKPKRVIRSVERQCSRTLSDDELLMVSAAGDATVPTMHPETLLGRHARPDNTEENRP